MDRDKIASLIEEALHNSSGHSSPVHKHNYNSSLPDTLPTVPPTESTMVSKFPLNNQKWIKNPLTDLEVLKEFVFLFVSDYSLFKAPYSFIC